MGVTEQEYCSPPSPWITTLAVPVGRVTVRIRLNPAELTCLPSSLEKAPKKFLLAEPQRKTFFLEGKNYEHNFKIQPLKSRGVAGGAWIEMVRPHKYNYFFCWSRPNGIFH